MTNPERKKIVGLPPGSVVFTGHRKVDKIEIHYLEYNEQRITDQQLDNLGIQDFHEPNPDLVQWYDVRGLHDTELIEEFGKVFSVHSLALEDIADASQRPKLEEYDTGLFVSMKAMRFVPGTASIEREQVSFYLGQGFLLSFQEDADDLFKVIRERLDAGKGRIRRRGADYLLYALMDFLVDNYFLALDDIGVVVDELEAKIEKNLSLNSRSSIYELKQELLTIRKSIHPLRELLVKLIAEENALVDEKTDIFFRDLRDHVLQIAELTETYRENLNSLQDLMLSELGHRTNGVMKVLTIVSTIFIPLTFLAGIYGMNFSYIPELQYKYGYFVLLGVMAIITILMVAYFTKKGWFRNE